MTTEITVTRKEGNQDVKVELMSTYSQDKEVVLGEPAILKSEGESVSHHVHSTQRVMVSEVEPGESTEPGTDAPANDNGTAPAE